MRPKRRRRSGPRLSARMQIPTPEPQIVIPGRRAAASSEAIFQRPVFMDSGPRPLADPGMTSRGAGGRPKLLFLVTEDWYFWSHRLPVARAARDAGFDVVVATRVQAHGERIRGEGFRLCPLGGRRACRRAEPGGRRRADPIWRRSHADCAGPRLRDRYDAFPTAAGTGR